MMKLIFALAVAASAAPALAGDGRSDAPTRRVRVADLNMSSAQGIATLDRRINAAARAICDTPDQSDLQAKRAYRRCVSATRQAAQQQRDALVAQGQERMAPVALSR